MIHELLLLAQEIVAEVAADIADNPLRLVAELVQFALLVLIVWAVAVGFGKRRGFMVNMLSERADRVARQLDGAHGAEHRLAEAQAQAETVEREGRDQAAQLVKGATAQAEIIEQEGRSLADDEAALLLLRARTALDNETAEMHQAVREQLVELVAQATRSIMNERMSVAEQRELIEAAILSGLREGRAAAPASPRRRRQSMPEPPS